MPPAEKSGSSVAPAEGKDIKNSTTTIMQKLTGTTVSGLISGTAFHPTEVAIKRWQNSTLPAKEAWRDMDKFKGVIFSEASTRNMFYKTRSLFAGLPLGTLHKCTTFSYTVVAQAHFSDYLANSQFHSYYQNVFGPKWT